MEYSQIEIAAVTEIVIQSDDQVEELNELQLAMVGGGLGEAILA